MMNLIARVGERASRRARDRRVKRLRDSGRFVLECGRCSFYSWCDWSEPYMSSTLARFRRHMLSEHGVDRVPGW